MPPPPRCTPQSLRSAARAHRLPLLSLLSILLAIPLGCLLRAVPGELPYDAVAWVGIWGELFMRMLTCLIVPIVTTCIITGLTSLDGSAASTGRLGTVAFLYILLGNFAGSALGALLAGLMRPGQGMGHSASSAGNEFTSYTDIFQDMLRNLVPDNLIGVTMKAAYTDYNITYLPHNLTLLAGNITHITHNLTHDLTHNLTYLPDNISLLAGNITHITHDLTHALTHDLTHNVTHDHLATGPPAIADIQRTVRTRDGVNTIGLVSVSIVLGLAINAAGKQAEPLLLVIRAMYTVVEKILFAMFWYAPIGIFSLITTAIIRVDSLNDVILSMGWFVLTFSVCFVLHIAVFIPTLYVLVCRKNPLRYFARIMDALLAGFAPPTSTAALPYLLEDAKFKLGIIPEIANFFLPLSVTLNRDGSAMFVTCTAVFVAQAQGIPLSPGTYAVIVLITTVMSFTIATIPSGSVVLAVIVCTAVQVPMHEMVGLIMLTEFIMDRLRTTNNVASHAFGCAIVQRFAGLSRDAPEVELRDHVTSVHVDVMDEEENAETEKLCANNGLTADV